MALLRSKQWAALSSRKEVFMIRDLAKSAVSFSWALSLLGMKQAVSLLKPVQKQEGNLLAPVIQVAVDQLDDSMKNIYRSGDNLQSRAVDLAFVLINPVNWINSRTWTHPFADRGMQVGSNTSTGREAHSGIPDATNRSSNFVGQAGNGQSTESRKATASAPTDVPISNESAAVGWGPMPVDS